MTGAETGALLGVVATACSALGGAAGAWFKGRAEAAKAKAEGDATEAVAAHDADKTISPALLERIRVLEARCDACDERDKANRVMLVQAGHDLEAVRVELRETKREGDGLRAELRDARSEIAWLREHSWASPAGPD